MELSLSELPLLSPGQYTSCFATLRFSGSSAQVLWRSPVVSLLITAQHFVIDVRPKVSRFERALAHGCRKCDGADAADGERSSAQVDRYLEAECGGDCCQRQRNGARHRFSSAIDAVAQAVGVAAATLIRIWAACWRIGLHYCLTRNRPLRTTALGEIPASGPHAVRNSWDFRAFADSS